MTTITSLEERKIYRLARRQIGGLLYQALYDRGDYIHVQILSGPDKDGAYEACTRGDHGEHLGPGGGWHGESKLRVWPQQVEEIP